MYVFFQHLNLSLQACGALCPEWAAIWALAERLAASKPRKIIVRVWILYRLEGTIHGTCKLRSLIAVTYIERVNNKHGKKSHDNFDNERPIQVTPTYQYVNKSAQVMIYRIQYTNYYYTIFSTWEYKSFTDNLSYKYHVILKIERLFSRFWPT